MNNQKDSIVEAVIKDISERAEVGLKKYNTTMDREDLISSDWVQHAYEECLDMALYLKRLRKDMLAMEEELRGYKTRDMVRERFEELQNKTLDSSGSKEAYSKESRNPSSTNIGMRFVYNTPSETKE